MERLSDRAPLVLLKFLGLHEQQDIGFNLPDQLHRISDINLSISGQPKVKIPSNSLNVYDGEPKVFYKVDLSYYKWPSVSSTPKSSRNSLPLNVELYQQKQTSGPKILEEVTLYKTWGDFKHLNSYIK